MIKRYHVLGIVFCKNFPDPESGGLVSILRAWFVGLCDRHDDICCNPADNGNAFNLHVAAEYGLRT